MTNYLKNCKYWQMAEDDLATTLDEIKLVVDNPGELIVELRAEPTDRQGELIWRLNPHTLSVTDKDSPIIELNSDDEWIIQRAVEDFLDLKETVKAQTYEWDEGWGDNGYWVATVCQLKLKDKDGFEMPVRITASIHLPEED